MTKRILLFSLILIGLVQFSFGQGKTTSAKQKQVDKLVQITEKFFPYQQFDEMFSKKNNSLSKEFEQQITKQTIDKIEEGTKLTSEQKTQLKSKVPLFTQSVAKSLNELIARNFTLKKWIKESATENFSKNLTLAELRKLNASLVTPGGQKSLIALNNALIEGFNPEASNSNSVDAEKNAKYAERFFKTREGEKLFEILTTNILEDINLKIEKWSDDFGKELNYSRTQGELRQIIEDFFKDSF